MRVIKLVRYSATVEEDFDFLSAFSWHNVDLNKISLILLSDICALNYMEQEELLSYKYFKQIKYTSA